MITLFPTHGYIISFEILVIIIALLTTALVGLGLRFYLKKGSETLSSKQKTAWLLSLSATFFITFGLASIFLLTPFNEWVLCSAVNRIPIMPAIKEYHPKQYQDLMEKAKESVKKKENPTKFIGYAFIYANQIFINDLKNAPDDEIYQYILEIKQFYDILYQHNPKLVIMMEKADVALTKELPVLLEDPDFKVVFEKAVDVKMNVIAGAIKNPSSPPPERIVRPLFNKIMGKLNEKYGEKVVNDTFNMTNISIPPELESKVIIDFYREIVNMNKTNVGELMRYIAFLSAKQNPT